jgi:plasmid maintenance system antidote protein VapI
MTYMPNDITQDEARKMLQEIVNKSDTKTEAARLIGISLPHLLDLLAGNRKISDNVARKLGYRRVVMYKKIEE